MRAGEIEIITWFPKYAACAIWQNRPTSTTPVNIFIWAIIYSQVQSGVRGRCRNVVYRVRVLHCFLIKRRIDDEITIVGHQRTGYEIKWADWSEVKREARTFLNGHPKRGVGWSKNMMQILEDFCICKRDDFDRNTLTELEQDDDSSRDSRFFLNK